MDRRRFLKGLSTIACSAAAHPLTTTMTLAADETGHMLGENRLIVIILRGAMDGLDLLRPRFDPDLITRRPDLATGGLPLTDGYDLNPNLAGLPDLWRAKELGFVQATSTPYRDVRSHFDGQDILEAGSGLDVPDTQIRDGWLNRFLQSYPNLSSETAYVIGGHMALTHGAAPTRNWSPGLRLDVGNQMQLLLDHIAHDDALFRDATAMALTLTEDLGPMRMAQDRGKGQTDSTTEVADFAASRLRGASRIAAFSLSGWDTHRGQSAAIRQPLRRLEQIILRLKSGVGEEVWAKTLVMAMTEFGRTVGQNGTGGTDHGTGGTALLAGGALRGGQIFGAWPGLQEADLYGRRDVMPTSDIRAWAGWALRSLYGIDRHVIETRIFPNLDMGPDPRLLRG